jgi:hypothetical protein
MVAQRMVNARVKESLLPRGVTAPFGARDALPSDLLNPVIECNN